MVRARTVRRPERTVVLARKPPLIAVAQHDAVGRCQPSVVPRAEHGYEEQARAGNYPLSRWYLRPLAGLLAARLAKTRVRPWHVTLVGFSLAVTAGVLIVVNASLLPISALLALGWWFCDRTDGQLARRQGTASTLGAWLDGNLDETVDLGLHAAMAYAAALQGSAYAWPLLIALFSGKYLLMHSLMEPKVVKSLRELTDLPKGSPLVADEQRPLRSRRLAERVDYFKTLYHLPGNADVRTHLMVLALATGHITAELAVIAIYYNLRWIARYPLVIARARREAA